MLSSDEKSLLASAKKYLATIGTRNRDALHALVIQSGTSTALSNQFAPETLEQMIKSMPLEYSTEPLEERYVDEENVIVKVCGECIGVVCGISEVYLAGTLVLRGETITTWVKRDDTWLMCASADDMCRAYLAFPSVRSSVHIHIIQQEPEKG
ncbi:hypothetical protein F5884DRAFT_749260 [Xylogone sp. PMI_703]|nr:hypothetical protein F5884DRAFT_749260 [Xylogone sp. PMI_703]